MAATDTFESILASLSEQERKQIGPYLRAQQADLMAARSEDARLRIVGECVGEVHRILKQARR
jgi:hypothetical protein